MHLDELVRVINGFCSEGLSEEWDNPGFQLRCDNNIVDNVLVSLEVTDEIITEAIENNVDVIITHHPMIFGGINKIDCNDITGRYILRLAEADISVYSCHTSFDKMDNGNNDYLGEILELRNIVPFDNDNGFCRKGDTPFEVTFAEFIHKAAETLEIDEKYFKIVGNLTKTIEKVGWCTGAGAEFMKDAIKEGCDLYITGDLKYHDAQFAKESGICVLDAGHYGSEKIFAENMANILRQKTNINILESKIDINPFL